MTERQEWGRRGAAPTGPRGRDRGRGRERTARRAGRTRQAEAAFDLLHLRHAPAFTRQTYLLCGHPGIAERAVAYAFRTAWERWPEVAVDRDPAGWVRALAYDYALSPWHRLVPGRHELPMHPGPPADRALLAGLLALPRPYRRSLLLHDGLGLDAAGMAAETEASTAAARGRLTHAREVLAERVPELRTARETRRVPLLTERLRLLLTSDAVRPPPPAGQVRAGCERAVRRRTGAAYGLTAAVAAAVAVTLATAEQWADRVPDRGGTAPAVSSSPAPDAGPREGAGDRMRGPAYLPELRSGNFRVRLTEEGGEPAVEPAGR